MKNCFCTLILAISLAAACSGPDKGTHQAAANGGTRGPGGTTSLGTTTATTTVGGSTSIGAGSGVGGRVDGTALTSAATTIPSTEDRTGGSPNTGGASPAASSDAGANPAGGATAASSETGGHLAGAAAGASSDTGANPAGGATNAGGGPIGGVANTTGSSITGGATNIDAGSALGLCESDAGMANRPEQSEVLGLMRQANDYFVQKWPDPTTDIVTIYTDPSNVWHRAVYYEGLMALYAIESDSTRKASYYDYAVTWGASPSHPWQVTHGGTTSRNADSQCCGQTYIDLYNSDPQPERIRDIKTNIDNMLGSGSSNTDWSWIDAIQMAMPVFAKLGVLYGDTRYFEKMYSLYVNTRDVRGLFNEADHLWWRDSRFNPPATTPNGRQCYWSRGNGWVFAGLTRVLDTIPTSEAHREEYIVDFLSMAEALRAIQRSDGFWNVSLVDPDDFGGPELSGTALFTYGMAWGIRAGVLDADTYGPVVTKAWCGMAGAVHDNGFLGYVQSGATRPSDGQPVTYDSVPNVEDFGLGCFLLAGSEVYKLASG